MYQQLLIGILVILITSGITLSYVLLAQRVKYWKESYFSENERYTEALDKTLQAEREKQQAIAENQYVHSAFKQMMERPVVAALTDQQAANLATAVINYISAVTDTSKERMN